MALCRIFVLGWMAIVCLSCSLEQRAFRKIENLISQKKHHQAALLLHRLVEVANKKEDKLKAAQKGVFLSERYTKDYRSWIQFLRVVILYSEEQVAREMAQKKIADIYFHQLSNYPKAIEEYSRFLLLDREDISSRFSVAKANYYLGRFDQALAELDYVKATSKELEFEVAFLRANLLTHTKKKDEAMQLYSVLLKKFPKKTKTVALNFAVLLEEQSQFQQAIDVLQQILVQEPDQKDFVELKVARLREIQRLQPGVRGYRK